MKQPILIISPDFPPHPGGVADYCGILAQALAQRFDVTVLTSTLNARAGDLHLRCYESPWSEAERLVAAINDGPASSVILWQYVPHMYGRGGVNSALPEVMERLRSQGRKQIVIAHEIAAGLSLLPHRLRYALAHRRQWRRICKSVDAIGVSTEAWLRAAIPWTNRKPGVFLSPSPSGIPVEPVPPDNCRIWREQHGLPSHARVLAYFGTISGNRHMDRLMTAWQQAQRPGNPCALVFIGGIPDVVIPDNLKGLFFAPGFLPAAEVSRALQATDLLALPFTDGVSERRTTFMTGLSHGVPVLTTLGHNTGTTLRAADFFRAVRCDDKEGFAAAAIELLEHTEIRRGLGLAGRQAYEKSYSWPVVSGLVSDKIIEFGGSGLVSAIKGEL